MKTIRKLSALALSACMVLSFAACGGDPAEEHTHTFSETWSTSETQHWHAATCGHDSEKKDLGDHSYGDDDICDVCGYRKQGGGTVEPDPPGPPAEQTASDVVRLLEETPYTSDEITGNFGLSDPTAVGVIESEVKEAYSPRADEEFSAGQIIVFDDLAGANDTEKFSNALAAAKEANARGDVKLALPDRVISLVSTVSFEGFDGLWVEGGENTELNLDCSQTGWMRGVTVSGCKDFHLNSVKLDYKVLPSITGIVTGSDSEALSVTMSIPEEFKPTVEAYLANGKLASTLQSIVQFNPYTLGPDEEGNYAVNSEGHIKSAEFNGNDSVTVVFAPSYRDRYKTPVNGAPYALGFAMYGTNGFEFSDCEDVYLEDVTIYSCPGMACVVSSVKNFYANRFDIERRTENRYMTATADGFHLVLCTGEVKITNCVIENTHDDAMNIKSGYWYDVTAKDTRARTFTLVRRTGDMLFPEPGDKIELYNENSFAPVGNEDGYTVESVSGNAQTMTVTVKERIASSVDISGARATNVSRTAQLTFRNNIVRNKRNRGILVQVRGAVIENNMFRNVGQGSMMIASSMDNFNEATVPRDITVRNNKLINNGYLLLGAIPGDISFFAHSSVNTNAPAGVISGIHIENNYIAKNGNAGIAFHGVGDSEIKNNLLYNVARVYITALAECALDLANSGDILIKGNYNYNTNESPTFSGIITSGSTDTRLITLEDNFNLRYQDLGGDVATYQVAKATGQITVDGDISEWASFGTDIVLDGASTTDGKELQRNDFKADFDVLTAKLAWTDEGIYVAFDIYDNQLKYASVNDFWEGDCFEMFLSTITSMPNADFMLYRNEGDVIQLAMCANWPTKHTLAAVRTSDSILSAASSIRSAMTARSDGYSGELFIPFTILPTAKQMIDGGEAFAMGFVFMDTDREDTGRKRIQFANVPHHVEGYKTNTARMPRYLFVETAE